MNPFVAVTGSEATLQRFCWLHGISVGELLAANEGIRVDGSGDAGPPRLLSELTESDVLPSGLRLRLPVTLCVSQRPYGEYFTVRDFRSRLNAANVFHAFDDVDFATPPQRVALSPVERLAQLLAEDAAQQARGLLTRAPQEQHAVRLTDAVDSSGAMGAVAALEAEVASSPLRSVQCGPTMATPDVAKPINIASGAATPLAAADRSDGFVDARTAVQLHLDVFQPHSLGKLKESWIFADGQCLCMLADVLSCPRARLPHFHSRNSMMFIGGVFFVDTRHKNSSPEFCDLSEAIRSWDPFEDGGVYSTCPTHPMESVAFEDLRVKLGEMCVFRHHGNCDHYFTFTSVRRLGRSGSSSSSTHASGGPQSESGVEAAAASDNGTHVPLSVFPILEYRCPDEITLCDMCSGLPATTLVYGDRLTPRNPTLFCDFCHHAFHCDDDGNEVSDGYVAFTLPPGHHV